AHFARSALGDQSVRLRAGQVELAPDAQVVVDTERFESNGDPELYTGELLPDDRYSDWAEEPRQRLRSLHLELLRESGRWRDLARADPADEPAARELMRSHAAAGDTHAALRRFRTLSDALAVRGLRPSEETAALYDDISSGPPATAPTAGGRPLVGRDRELREALEALRRAGGGRGGGLLVCGEAGAGKTRLCEEILARASGDGWTTLRGAAAEAEGAVPYAPVAEALDGLLLERPDLAARVTEPARAQLARLCSALPGPAAEPHGRADRQRIFAACGQLLSVSARERGAVLLMDDLHAADTATVQLVHYFARAARFQPLLIVIAFREGELAHALAEVRASLLDQRVAVSLRLGPLARAAADALVRRAAAEPPSDQTLGRIWRLSGGNPFFCEELGAAVRPDGELEVPARVHEIVNARIARLEHSLRRVLSRVGVLGDSFTAEEAVALSESGAKHALAALDAALAAGVIEEQAAGYRFRHAVVREALTFSEPGHRRAEAHRVAAERLAQMGAPPSR
ncbi:MAG: ATP-binding protein, partial [Thermoleophilaceae bacterium]